MRAPLPAGSKCAPPATPNTFCLPSRAAQALLDDKPRSEKITANSELHLLVLNAEAYSEVLRNTQAKASHAKSTDGDLIEDFTPPLAHWDAHLHLSASRQILRDGRYQKGDLKHNDAEERANRTESNRDHKDVEVRLKDYGYGQGDGRSIKKPDLRGCTSFEEVNPEWWRRLTSIGMQQQPCVGVEEDFRRTRGAPSFLSRFGDRHPPERLPCLGERWSSAADPLVLFNLLCCMRCAGRYIGHGFQAHDFSADGAAEDLIVFVDRHFTRKVKLRTNVTSIQKAIDVLAPCLPNCTVIENTHEGISVVSKNRGVSSAVEVPPPPLAATRVPSSSSHY